MSGLSFSVNSETYEGWLLEIDETGNLIWEIFYNDGEYVEFNRIHVVNSSYYIIGTRGEYTPAYNSDILLLNFDLLGNILWDTTFNLYEDWGIDFQIFDEDKFIILSSTYSNLTGKILWLLRLGPEVGIIENLPTPEFQIYNHPNPFNPSTEIRFQLSDFSEIESVEIEIYNLKGQKVKSIFPSLCHPELIEGRGNEFSVIWSGKDINEQPVSSGVYLYKLNVDGKMKATRKCLLLK